MADGYTIDPAAMSALSTSMSGAATKLSGTAGGISAPDAGDASAVMLDMLATLTSNGADLITGLELGSRTVDASRDDYVNTDDAHSGEFDSGN